MIKHITNILIASIFLIFATISCDSQKQPGGGAADRFATQSAVCGAYLDGRQIFVYNSEIHQQAIRGLSYRIQTDDQSVLLSVRFDAIPTQSGTCTMSIVATGIDDFKTPDSFVMTLIKVAQDKLWFWDESRKLGIIVPTLQ